MVRNFYFLIFIIFISTSAYSTNYFAIANGDWGDASIWSLTPTGSGGAGVPGTGDIAITNGRQVGLNPIYGDVTVDRITVTNSVANSLYYSDPFFLFTPVTLNINLSLSSTGVPSAQIIEDNSFLNIVILGTGSTVINNWSTTSPFNTISFSSGGGTTINGNIAISNSLIVDSGTTFTIGSGYAVSNSSGSASITIESGSAMVVGGSINGGSASTNFPDVTMSGSATITVNTNGYLNSDGFTFSSGSTLNVTNNQPDGWWHSTSPGPSSVPVPGDYNFTVTYNRLGDQSVLPANYGNLILTGSGTKTLSSALSGLLKVFGDITIETTFSTSSNGNIIDLQGNLHNDGTWAPTQRINFNGTSAQSITGNNMVTFGGGITVSNSAGVSLSNQDADINGVLDIDPGASFDPNGRQVNLAGNLVNDGSLSASGVFVFDGTTTISGSGTNAFNDLTVTGSISAPSKTLTIAGDFANSGTFSNVNGTVTFNGINAQSISGSSTNNFYNLTVTNSGGTVSNNMNSNLNTAMTLGSGAVFDADGSGSGVFTVISTSGSNAARINAIPSDASVTGNVVVQRYFDGGGDVWRNFGTCVNGATVTQITSAGLTINGNDLAYYNESVTGGVDNGWVLQSTFGSSISNSRGYSMWTRTEEMPVTVSFSGTLNQHNQSIPLTYTSSGSPSDDGWNLVNNPFPSTVDWDLMTRNGSVSGTVAVWNTSTSSYDYWNGSTGNLTNGLIASGQAFWVQTNASSPTLTIPESAKATSSSSFLRSSDEEEQNLLIVSLSKADKVDRTYIHFREGAIDGFDTKYDGIKLRNGIFNLATLDSEGQSLAINTLAALGEFDEKTIKVDMYNTAWDNDLSDYVRVFEEGDYVLSFDNLESFSPLYDFVLIDNYLNKSTTLESGYEYNFNVTSDPESWGNSRFEIHLVSVVTDIENDLDGSEISLYPNPVSSVLHIDSKRLDVLNVRIYSTNGKLIYSSGKKIENEINMTFAPKGIYIVNIVTKSKTINYWKG